ncbi:acyl-CoA dehydrogenase family protein [Nocardia sp. NPDC057668]|uniref:acyl-CoA dehydrogenase family protein n=1 Tax=Nocardia sp. NPDC057668 TaxID=3346202 RepID=UPI00366CDD2D
MDFELTEAQQDLSGLTRDLVSAWTAAHPHPDTTGFDPALWRAFATAGILDAALPEPMGGGFGVLEQCAVLTEIGRAAAPVPYAASVSVCAAALARFGAPAQVARWAAPALRGETTLSPVLSGEYPMVTATRDGAGWQLSGARGVVPGGAHAAAFLVEAHTPDGPLLAMVDRGTAGVTVRRQRVVDAEDAALLEFDRAVVPSVAVVGPEPAGSSDGTAGMGTPAAWARRRSTLATCAHQLGVLERALAMTAEFAVLREQFGKPIGSFQAVRQRLADALIDVDAVRLSLWQAAWRESQGLPADSELAVAAFWAAEAGHRVAHTAVHIHAGSGIYLDLPLQRYFLAAKRNEFASGNATSHLRVLGDRLAVQAGC